MNPLLINHLIGFSLLVLILPLIACLVYSKNPMRRLNQAFSLYLISISWWALFTIFMITSKDKEWGFFWDKVCLSAVVFIPTLFFYFVISYIEKARSLDKVVKIDFLVSFIFLILIWTTKLFVKDVNPKFGMNYFTVPGAAYLFFVIFFLLNVILATTLLGFSLQHIRDPQFKKQASFFFWFSIIAYTGGSCNYLLVYDIDLPGVAETSNYGVLVYSLSIAYLIFKHGFLGIEVIIKRTLVFAGLLAFVFGVFSIVMFVAQEVLAVYFGYKRELALAISIFLIVLGYEPMRAFLIETTDKFLFQKKYDYQKLLKDASRGISQIESLDYLLRLVIHFITIRVRVKNAAVLTKDLKGGGGFSLSYRRGYPEGFGEIYALSRDNALIDYLGWEKEPVEIEQVKEYIDRGGKPAKKGQRPRRYDFLEIKQQMEALQAACAIPSFLGRELRNILVLGEKKSGDYYSKEDLDVLYTLAQESAIAIENARLYDEAVNRSKELQQINEELEKAQTRLVHALEESEKVNLELQQTQAQLIHEQKMATLGRLAASVGHEVNNPLTILSMNVSRAIMKYRKDPELQVAAILDLFKKMEQNIGRIKAVVNTLTGLLKKSEKGKFEPLSLKLLLEETLPLVQFQSYLDNLTGTEVEFDIASSIPLIRGDLERLQEVFLNLFINAYQAMAGRRNRRIVVQAHVKEPDSDPEKNGGKMVEVDFTDNGSGMTEEVQKKIFTYGFTTKGSARGSGMGLYICKYIIELHGGEIKVQSSPGMGTTFTITLPAYEETSRIGTNGGGNSER